MTARAAVTQRDVTPGDGPAVPDPLDTLSELEAEHASVSRAWSEALAASPTVLGETLGSVVPRLWTRPLRELRPAVRSPLGVVLESATSYGYAVIAFARDVLREPLDPWQEWLVIHGGELLPDGRPRFRTVLAMVARQNGKTHLLKVLILYWMFVEHQPMTVGMSTTLEYAKEAWSKAVATVQTSGLQQRMPTGRGRGILDNNNRTQMTTARGCVYRLAARNRKGGRSLTIDRLVVDELREHDSFAAWSASEPALNARPFGQIWCITNAGDETSVVLDQLRTAALAYMLDYAIRTGQDAVPIRRALELEGVGALEGVESDERLGLAEWSAEPGAELDDPDALAAANPNLGRRIGLDTLIGMAKRVKADPMKRDKEGVTAEARYRTEVMCQKVPKMDPAIDPIAWKACKLLGDLQLAKARIAACIDVSPDMQHGVMVAGGKLPDGRTRVEIVQVWEGPRALANMRRDLPKLTERVRPQRLGWFPGGPAASLDADLRDRTEKGRLRTATTWPPKGVTVAELTGEVSAVCMGFAAAVMAQDVVHSAEPLLDDHVMGAGKLHTGDTWRFSRQGDGHCDAAYAAAGADFLARTLPAAVGKPRLVLPSEGGEGVPSRT